MFQLVSRSDEQAWAKSAVYKALASRVYRGDAVHTGVRYPGEHAPIVDGALWNRAQARLAMPARSRATTRATVPMLLKGLIFGPDGRPMSPSHTRRRGRTYRCYVSRIRRLALLAPDLVEATLAGTLDQGAILDRLEKGVRTIGGSSGSWLASR